jgi:hypothetical protein
MTYWKDFTLPTGLLEIDGGLTYEGTQVTPERFMKTWLGSRALSIRAPGYGQNKLGPCHLAWSQLMMKIIMSRLR